MDKTWAFVAAGAVAALLGGTALWLGLNRGSDPFAQCRAGQAGADIGGPFTLVDGATGKTVTDKEVIDRPTLVDVILEGYGRPAADNCISPGYRYLLETAAPKYDPAGARKLLAEAGYPQGIKIPLVCSNRPAIRSQVGVAVKEMAKAAGFDIDVQTIPHDTYLANVWMKGQFYIGYWGMQSTEDQAFTLLFTSDASFADTAWNNKEFDGLVAKGRATLDDAERRKIYDDAQKLMVKDVPSVIPFFQDVLTANRSYVRNWVGHPLSRYFFVENVWLDKA